MQFWQKLMGKSIKTTPPNSMLSLEVFLLFLSENFCNRQFQNIEVRKTLPITLKVRELRGSIT